MFGGALGEEAKRYFESLVAARNDRLGAVAATKKVRDDNGAIHVPYLNFAISTPRRYHSVIPSVGTLHECCESLGTFTTIASRLLIMSMTPGLRSINRLVANDDSAGRTDSFLIPKLTTSSNSLTFFQYSETEAAGHRNAYSSVMNSYKTMQTSDAFNQLLNFMEMFAKLLSTSFDDVGNAENLKCGLTTGNSEPMVKRAKVDVPVYDKPHGTLELFQKMILMHATYFLASVILGDHAERADNVLRVLFDTPNFSEETIRHFRQRATVFLVPRRHGKTWFLVPLIALAMATFKGIRVGYTSHIRKALEPVFEAINDRLVAWFGIGRTEHVKGETITFSFPDGSKSTATFASSHNTNSIRGQDFNLLFVDEAHFIRPDAVQTIVGFLSQVNCKVVFVSSTNSGKSSTCFLYGLKGAADGLLNVVSYVCDDHMKHVTVYGDATACSCYVLNKPMFITMDGAMRRTAELFLPESFMQEIIGGGATTQDTTCRLFTPSAVDRFLLYRPSTIRNLDNLGQELFVYVDPAFTSNTRASGTGVAVVEKHNSDYIIFGLEHFFLRALTGEAADAIGGCVSQCIAQICSTHDRRFAHVYIAVEGNSSEDSAVAIAARINAEIQSYARSVIGKGPTELCFYHTTPPGSNVAYPMFLLQKQKTDAFCHFIKMFNSGRVLISQDMVSLTISLDTDPAEYLTKQMLNICETVNCSSNSRSFSGKKGGMADDTVVALIMAIYLSTFSTQRDYFPLSMRDE